MSLLRFVAALIFMADGSPKIPGVPAGGMTAPAFLSKFRITGMMELIGGGLLVLGLFSRPVAFLLSGLMAVAYWTAHAPQSPYPVLNGGDAAILYCFVFLYIVFAGPGPISLDRIMGRDR
ncbi:MAG: DoxX family protein [Paracoccaceae bacterium]